MAGALVFLLGLPLAALAAPAPHLTIDVSSLDFGQIDPSLPGGVLPARVNLLVSGDSAAFEVSIATSPDPATDGRLPPARFAWRVPGDRFRELAPMTPFPVASGPSAAPGPLKVGLDIEPLAGWEMPPGAYTTRLQLFVNGEVVTDFVRMTFRVPPRVDLTVTTQPMESPAINPVQADSYPYARRLALIRSNVPWRLAAWIEGRPRKNNSGSTLSAAEFRIAALPGAPVALAPGVRTVLARGDATPAGPRSVAVDLWLDVRDPEKAGTYRTRLHLSADPDTGDIGK